MLPQDDKRKAVPTGCYLKLAGTVFPDEAAALEQRMLGEPGTHSGTHLGEPELI